MKQIIFIEGVDGSGKTTLSNSLKDLLSKKYRAGAIVLNRQYPKYYADLFEIDAKNNVQCSKLSKLSYRIARLNLALDKEVRAKGRAAIFDRGVINTIVDSIHDGIDQKHLTSFLEDIFFQFREYGIQLILLKPPIDEIFRRLAERKILTSKEKNKTYIESYYSLVLQVFEDLPYTDNKLIIDTAELSIEAALKKIEEVILLE